LPPGAKRGGGGGQGENHFRTTVRLTRNPQNDTPAERAPLKKPMDKTSNNSQPNRLFFVVVLAGIAARLLVATYGHNYDVDSWRIAANIVDRGGNVYAATARYNYGPVWFNVLHALNLLAGHNETAFRYLLTGFLSLVDAGIFFILWRKFGKLAASLFFLNPVSVIITGYHSQFDNCAILSGLLAALLVGDEFDKPISGRKFWGLVVLGISLATKHLLFAFPLWLAIKQKGILQKFAMILIPVFVFALSFVPYWPEGKQGIIQNVFLYRSATNEYFYRLFVPMGVQFMFNSQMLWVLLLAIFAFIYRQKNTVESLLLYTCVLVATSPAIVNQYLAIPIPFVATHLNPFTILYTAIATVHLFIDVNGFHLASLTRTTGADLSALTGGFPLKADSLTSTGCADIAVYLLCLGLVWVTWRQNILTLLERCVFEVKNQLGFKK
jgi:hypothetical protein